MYIILLILWNFLVAPPTAFPEWAAEQIASAVDTTTPVRLVWNQSVAPPNVESALLARGVVLTTSVAAARIEVATEETASGDIHMTVRSIDASGLLMSSQRLTYSSPKSAFRKTFDRFASPALITAATGLTIYLLYNVRSR
jgi:hypothetical protein